MKLLECAVMASRGLHTARYGLDAVDLGYLERASDESLRAIVRAWFHADDVDALLEPGPRFAA